MRQFLSLEPWGAGIAYEAGQHVTYNGKIFRAKSDFTSGGAFVLANWDVILDRPGGELASVESFDDTFQNKTNTAWADFPNLPILEFSVTTRPVYLELWCPYLMVAAATILDARLVSNDGNTQHALIQKYAGVAFNIDQLHIKRRLTTPGSYTVKPQFKTNNAANTYGLRPGGAVALGAPTVLLTATEG